MNKKTKQKLKEVLEKEKAHLEATLAEIAGENKKAKGHYDVRFPQYGSDKDANAQEISDFERNKALEEQMERELSDINKALTQMEEGTYGTCTNCTTSIKEERLQAIPHAQLCISCANN